MYYAAENETLSMINIKPFDTFDDMTHWQKWKGRLQISAGIAEEILKMRRVPHRIPDDVYISYCDPDNDDAEPIDSEYTYYAVADDCIDALDIECFRTEQERDQWCIESECCFAIPISRKLAQELKKAYNYIEDVILSRDGIVFIRV